MLDRRGGYEYEDLLACGRGELFGPGNAQLPLPPMLMFDRIAEISDTGGEYGKGLVRAELTAQLLALVGPDVGKARIRRELEIGPDLVEPGLQVAGVPELNHSLGP